jgi:nickel superoxide dismutase
MRYIITSLVLLVLVMASASKTYAHCEVPCGIFDDEARVKMIREDIATIEKAILQIEELSKASPVNHNQVIRWVMTKEDHANKIQETVSQYFMAQRVKPVDPADQEAHAKYLSQLTALHDLMIFAVKSQQSLDLQNIVKMHEAVDRFEIAYFGHKHD